MIALLIDENFDQRILRGLKLRLPELDYFITQTIGLGGIDDPELLDWAANEGRVIVTHDVNTMTKFASERLRMGLPMPGVIIVPEQMEISPAIDDLEILIECSTAVDLKNQIQYLPL
jgi:predicted nuclease of predicted toxin-antitoxin system